LFHNLLSTSFNIEDTIQEIQPQTLPPHIPSKGGGQWLGTTGYPLLREHYVPIQPTLRHLRRPTLHDYDHLQQYIQHQSAIEREIIRKNQQHHHHLVDNQLHTRTTMLQQQLPLHEAGPRPRRTIYMDGVFDLFHIGHVHAIEQCAQLGDIVIIGVVSDTDATSYKRAPIISESDRIAVVMAMKYVDQVICPCPLIVDAEFMQQYSIDLVVHGFANVADAEKQREFFRVPQQLNQFQQIQYYDKLSTTDIIQKIVQSVRSVPSSSMDVNADVNDVNMGNTAAAIELESSNRFGTAFESATNISYTIPYDPFPMQLRTIIDPHIQKARRKQNAAIESVCQSSNQTITKILQMVQNSNPLSTEGIFQFDVKRYPLRETLLRCGGFCPNFDLTKLHEGCDHKDTLLQSLTCNYVPFQEMYDDFVRTVCIPHMISDDAVDTAVDEYYYQAFPCIRIVQPNEFSIGPHSDITYGHHIGCVNMYVPFTCIDGSAALFLESRYGSEDWHPIVGNYGMVKHFAGASCLHWTTNNTSGYTRVSLDFRVVAGSIYNELSNHGGAYRDGFYNCCRLGENGTWERVNEVMPPPDKRAGFPWTVADWDAYLQRKNG
jgi:cytidyltransferase-like protein